jgi:hypothetical protein
MKKLLLSLFVLFIFASLNSRAQLSITQADQPYTVSFDATVAGVNSGSFNGGGFSMPLGPGQLNANAWAVYGTSEGDKDFGDNATSGVFARGISGGGVANYGIYAFNVETGNRALGIQSGDDDFTPGGVAIMFTNNSGISTVGISIAHDIWIYNDQNSSIEIKGQFSLNPQWGWVDIDELSVTTQPDADPVPAWEKTTVSITRNLNFTNGNTMYFRWYIEEVSGSGERDEIAIDNFTVLLHEQFPCIPLVLTNFPNNTFTETFEEDSDYLHCWTQEYVSANNDWTNETGAGAGSITTAYDGDRNARFTATMGGPQVTKLISPVFDLSGVTNPIVRFWYGQEANGGNQNELKVYYRVSEVAPWVEIEHYTENIEEWTIVPHLDLPNPTSTYQVAFEGIDNNGRPNVLDNVSILSMNDLPYITDIDFNNDVQDIQVCLGTEDVNIPISLLPQEIIIMDSHDIETSVEVDWTIPGYNGNMAGTYTANGTFALPPNVEQSSPTTSLTVSTDVNVIDLPVVICPEDWLLNEPGNNTLTGSNPAGGNYFYDGNIITGFDAEDYSNGDYTISYIYTDPSTTCTNSCDFTITVQLPAEIEDIDIYDDVQDVYVCIGTSQSEATQALTQTLTISDSNGGEYVVDISWDFTAYNGYNAGTYNAIGTFVLPDGVNQSDPITPLVVYAAVTVADDPVVTCPEDMLVLITDDSFTLEGAEPEGGEYLINGNPFWLFNPSIQGFGDHTVSYNYTDPVTGCSNSCEYTISVVLEINIEENFIEKFTIYPNPNKGKFTINTHGFDNIQSIEIFDLQGKLIFNKTNINNNTSSIEINTDLSEGVYFIRLNSQSSSAVQKIIIK